MKKINLFLIVLTSVLLCSTYSRAEVPWLPEGKTRYLAMGDSIAAGYGAIPVTQGYPYLLYQSGSIDSISNVLFANAAVPGATSEQVLDYQVPLATESFPADVITLSFGGNDVLKILQGEDAGTVLAEFGNNLATTLYQLRYALPDSKIYISNLYSIPEIPGSDEVIQYFNYIVSSVASGYGVPVADVYSAFDGKQGVLLIDRHDAGVNVHPTNKGYQLIAQAFRDAMESEY